MYLRIRSIRFRTSVSRDISSARIVLWIGRSLERLWLKKPQRTFGQLKSNWFGSNLSVRDKKIIDRFAITLIAHAEGTAREATEIQNVQLAMGDVCRKLSIPIYMIFPRLFTCPTLSTRTFKVDFEINLVVLFQNGYMITENFPVVLYR